MILAGIDEAGLGPAMGPLCVCAAVLELDDAELALSGISLDDGASVAAWPWRALEGIAGQSARDKRSPLLVTDSKIAHKVRGVAGLEKAALAFWLCAGGASAGSGDEETFGAHEQAAPVWKAIGREGLLSSCGASDALLAFKACPWYAAGWTIPGQATEAEIVEAAGLLAAARGVRTRQMRARVLTEQMLNDLYARGLNKSEALLLQTGAHIRQAYRLDARQQTLVVVDKQGGRNFYAPFLSECLDGAWVQTVCEGPDLSEYVVARPDGAPMRVRFLPKADAAAFPVALASLFAKYLRERCMDGLNAWFCARIPGLEPTAGYHGDAPRFLEAVTPLLLQHNLPQSLIWRER